jgi:hypothetical protein
MPPERSRFREAGRQLDLLERAIDEFLEEGFAYTRNRREIEETAPEHRAAAMREWIPQRSQAEGFFGWLRYLVWLDGIREIVPLLPLSVAEVEGLSLLQRCRNRFQRSHPPCLHCGMPNSEYDFSCHHCLKELKH